MFSVRKLCTFLLYSSVFMITIVLPLSARTIITFTVASLLFMSFMMYACLFCVALFWLLELKICFSFLVSSMRYGSCSLTSSSLMARSVSIIRLVQHVLVVFLYCVVARGSLRLFLLF